MPLTSIDRDLLLKCLGKAPGSWEAFVDRFMGLVVHVCQQTAEVRSFKLSPADLEDLVAEVFLQIVRDDFTVLRRFKGDSSLATYLTVVARRACVREVVRRQLHAHHEHGSHNGAPPEPADHSTEREIERIVDRDEIARMMQALDERESHVVRMYHFEGKSYQEISDETGVAVNSIGPILHRAKEKIRAHSTSRT